MLSILETTHKVQISSILYHLIQVWGMYNPNHVQVIIMKWHIKKSSNKSYAVFREALHIYISTFFMSCYCCLDNKDITFKIEHLSLDPNFFGLC